MKTAKMRLGSAALALGLGGLVFGATPLAAQAEDTYQPIASVQGTGDKTPLEGQSVTIRGQVTPNYTQGRFHGFYLQDAMPGADHQASSGIFVYKDKKLAKVDTSISNCLAVTGTATEYFGLTQVKATKIEPAQDCAPIQPVSLRIPTDEAERERYEGMLIAPAGEYTVTDNYSLGRYGSIGLAIGSEPLYQATDVVKPGEEANKYEAENLTKLITLDDGDSTDFQKNPKNQLPYLAKAGDTVRTGSAVKFTGPVILDYRHGWNLQPLDKVEGTKNSPATFSDTRPKAPANVGGDLRLATFNVLNYFTDLGQDEDGCKAYKNVKGEGVTANRCQVRGAYTKQAFADQEGKIVAAIDGLKADVVALEEIENSAKYGKDRDHSLGLLVKALNQKAGSVVWKFVPSPKQVPNNGDAIRTAMIYRVGKVEPVGESVILDDSAFTGVARSPLAQRFHPVSTNGQTGQDFVLIANHFKSKGSQLEGEQNADQKDGQGNNNYQRVLQAKALAKFAEQFNELPVLLVGDFNSYAKEDPISTLESAGYARQVPQGHSYQYGGRIGSLDHVLANPAAAERLTGLAEWEINKDEPIALEYSRRLNTLTDVFEPDTPYRASDHDPVVIGLKVFPNPTVSADPDPTVKPTEKPTQPGTVNPSSKPGTGTEGDQSELTGQGNQKGQDNPVANAQKGQLGHTGTNLAVLALAVGLVLMGMLVIRGRKMSR